MIKVTPLILFVCLALYLVMWLRRKKISLLKLLGEREMTRWENICQEFKLGQAPAINFVSSCIITNDRVFITLRVMLAVWSMVVTVYTWAGNRSVFFGTYYPLAAYITIYVSRHRQVVQKTKSRIHYLADTVSIFSVEKNNSRILICFFNLTFSTKISIFSTKFSA